MTDDTKRGRRPKFEEAATIISDQPPLWKRPDNTTLPRLPHSGPGAPDPRAGAEPRRPSPMTDPRVARPTVEYVDMGEPDGDYEETPLNGTAMPRNGNGQGYRAPHPSGFVAPVEAPLQLAAPSPFVHRAAGGVSPDRSIALVHAPDSGAAAQWRLLKFKLKENGDPRVLAITSASQGEGKSVAAANLALSLAEGQRARVVLLEANLRAPALGSLFGLEVPLGLTDQLRRRRRDAESPWELYELASNFFFLPCGRPAENPAAMLGSEQFTGLVRDLRLYYDFVVIDTPGALVAADMNIVQDLVEGVVLVCRSGVSTRSQVQKAIGRLAKHNLVGMVLVEA
ncbi:MAG TPA: CpsD/CapB family tyrosine-protein kinase [Polyangia bacterium]|jgi:capsular exopolysaccharide synthesis family protein